MIEKICYACKRKLPLSMFYKVKNKADGHVNKCKDCVKEYQKEWYENNKEYSKEWRENNKEYSKEYGKKWCESNKDKRKKYFKEYNENNKDKRKEYFKEYNENNKDKRKEYHKKPSKYFQSRIVALQRYQKNPITGDLGTRRALDDKTLLEVKCKQCNKWFKPTNAQVESRIKAIKGQCSVGTENHFYCSDSCKNSCSIFHQKDYTKGTRPKSAREVDPYINELCLERDDYECQRCESPFDLEVHHIKGAVREPLLANDIDNVITLCEDCHDKVHAEEGCHYSDYKRDSCTEEQKIQVKNVKKKYKKAPIQLTIFDIGKKFI